MSTPDSVTGRLPPQSKLRQRYLIIGLVGQGGMGAVYQAIDIQVAHRRVAVKEMSQAYLNEDERAGAEARFLSEAALLGSLAHPGLPRVYEAFSERSRLYLVMDFIEGKTLSQLLKEGGGHPLPVMQMLSYAQQLCAVLAYLHQHHPPIIFRDLKPANVMVTEHGQIFLIDFGIARLFKAGQPQDTLFLGSPGYASPEQYGISQTNPRSDLYSLGVTLHHCLTAREPSLGDNHFAFVPIRQYNSQVPEELDQIIQRLVAVDEQKRPGSALEVHQALVHVIQQGIAPTELMPSLPPTPQLMYRAASGYAPGPPSPPIERVNRPLLPPAVGQAMPPPTLLQPGPRPPSEDIWTSSFTRLFGLLLALTVGGSVFAFNFITGSDHLVEFSLSLLLLLVLLGAAVAVRSPAAWTILALACGALVVAGIALLAQSVLAYAAPDMQTWIVTRFQAGTLNQLLTIGLGGTALASLLWLTRPSPWRSRLALLVVFGLSLACILWQYPAGDAEVPKHILLLIGLITLIQGALLASQIERLHRRKRMIR
jgi:tRNA A-37 threonylcarbamoyl transferase component Bud32